MRFLSIIVGLCLLLVGCNSAATVPTATPDPNIRVYTPPLPLIDFQLINQDGEMMRLNAFQGKLAMISFGFLHCPDVCPINLANYKIVKQELGADAEKVAFVFISVDGERDTPEALKQHLSLFDPAFIGLTGDESRVRPVANAFSVRYEKYMPEGTQADYLVNHTASLFLVNENGSLIRSYAYGTPPETIVADMKLFLPK